MTFREALEELGIERSSSREQARRVYLRRLRDRSPERDPEGFRRLREAFELVREVLSSRPEERAEGGGERGTGTGSGTGTSTSTSTSTSTEVSEEGEEEVEDVEVSPAPRGQFDLTALYRRAAMTTDPRSWGILAAAFDAAAARIDAGTPPAEPALRMMLRLHEVGDLHGAASLQRSFGAWVAAQQGGARMLQGASAARWALVSELAAASPELPPEVRAPIARALLEGDLAHARPALEAFRSKDGGAANEAWKVLTAKAPLLAASLPNIGFPTQTPPAAPWTPRPPPPQMFQTPPSRLGSGWAVLPLALVAFVLIRVCARSSSPKFSYDPPKFDFQVPKFDYKVPNYDYKIPNYDYQVPDYEAVPPSAPDPLVELARASEEALYLRDIASERGNRAVDRRIKQACTALSDAALAGDCKGVRRNLAKLRTNVEASDPTVDVRETLEVIQTRVTLGCPDEPEQKPKKKRKPAPATDPP